MMLVKQKNAFSRYAQCFGKYLLLGALSFYSSNLPMLRNCSKGVSIVGSSLIGHLGASHIVGASRIRDLDASRVVDTIPIGHLGASPIGPLGASEGVFFENAIAGKNFKMLLYRVLKGSNKIRWCEPPS